jgi:hypothetical protein
MPRRAPLKGSSAFGFSVDGLQKQQPLEPRKALGRNRRIPTMDPHLLRIFQLEVVKQCQFAIMAIQDLENASKDMNDMNRPAFNGMTRIWYSIQAFIIATGNLSKLLWPPRPIIPERGTELRASLSVEESSWLQPRILRDNFEHYDERLEKFFLSLKPPRKLPSKVDSPQGESSGTDLLPQN